MFELEAIKAKHGDCLILYWGETSNKQNRKVALIDGGPDLTYQQWLKPRLLKLARDYPDKRLKIELMMVSHIDDDHINGILDLVDDVANSDAPFDLETVWHNSLEGLLDEPIDTSDTDKVTASLSGALPDTKDYWQGKVLSSVPQGQQLHAFLGKLDIQAQMNQPIGKLVLFREGMERAEFSGLELEVLGPTVDELEKLRKKWGELRKESVTAAYSDRSVYNLSSIVVMAHYDGKRALFTGDARGDHVIDGLKAAGLMKKGRCHVDLLKLMHHGSRNNVTEEFFRQVTADAYVISGDHVKFPNPHESAMSWLAEARGDDDYHVYCTYEIPYMRDIFGDRLVTPQQDSHSVIIKI